MDVCEAHPVFAADAESTAEVGTVAAEPISNQVINRADKSNLLMLFHQMKGAHMQRESTPRTGILVQWYR
jgi:hypothetical protein